MNSSNFERLTAGESGAFAEVYDRYAPLVRSICFDRTRNLPQAEDLTQDVFLKAYERIGQLRDGARLAAWLAAIARRACQDWRRERRRDRHRYCENTPEMEAAPATAPDDREVELLRMAISELPEKERLALHIHYLCEEPAEVARDLLGLSSSGFYKRIDRARRRLAAILKPLGVEP